MFHVIEKKGFVIMDRLTYKSSMGDYGSAKYFDDYLEERCILRNALGQYEDLGYSADELKEMLQREDNKCKREK